VSRYNDAIWLSNSGRYTEAKALLAPLLNDTNISKKSEIAELYGDLIYTTSGSIDDTIRMYERSLSFSPSDRVTTKIAYIRNEEKMKQNPPNPL
jgi:tetratricopeptide (TPR) repeat protein